MASQKPDLQTTKKIFSQWSKEKLVDYAASLSRAMGIERAKHKALASQFESAKDWLQGLTLVEEIGQHLSSTLNLDEVLALLLKRVTEALDAEDGSILLTEELSGDLIFQISLGSISEEIKPFRIPKGEGIAGEVALTGVPIRVDNAQKDKRHFKQIDIDTGFLTKTILCVPLLTRQKVIGVIEVFNKRSGPFTDEDQVILSSIANFAAIAIENARLHQSVLAERDRVVQTQEEISRKLQRDLHDGPTQLVAAIQMNLDFAKQALKQDPALVEKELDEMMELAKKATHQMRTLLFELRPLVLETQGLEAALRTFLKRRQKDERTALHLTVTSTRHDNAIPRLVSKSEMAIFAIVQEAVNNALKHAMADNIYVTLNLKKDILSVNILDDGQGFDLNAVSNNYEDRGSYGMINIKERAAVAGGNLTMKSAPGAGTEIQVDIPLTPDLLAAD